MDSKKAYTAEETARLQQVIQEYGTKPIPSEVYDQLSQELGRTKGSLHSAIYGLRRAIDGNGPVDLKKLADALKYIHTATTQIIQENRELKKLLRELKDIRAAVEKFQAKKEV